ncbi:MAG TPA: tetratricopeptide repeat protein [Archangium sp.]
MLSGLYSVGELGLVQFSVVDGKVVGKVKLAVECTFANDTQVVTGVFEGGVFVGNVTLCQTGAGCPSQRTYPMLGVAHDDAVGGLIRLDSGCRSPALDDKALFIRPATPEEKQKVAGDASALALAAKQNGKDPAIAAVEAIADGQKLIQDTKFAQAREKFRQAMELDDVHWEAALGYGLTEVKLSRPEKSLEYFDKALTIAGQRKVQAAYVAQIHYNRACALVAMGEKKDAITSLRTALKLGGAANLLDQLTDDPDLGPIRSDPEFRRLVGEAQVQYNRKKPR